MGPPGAKCKMENPTTETSPKTTTACPTRRTKYVRITEADAAYFHPHSFMFQVLCRTFPFGL
jgi:hypothetical protein